MLVKNVPDALSLLFSDEQLKSSRGKKYDAVVLFAATQAELNKQIASTLAALQNDALLWIAYPKKSGTIKTDLSRDYGWDALTEADYIPVSLRGYRPDMVRSSFSQSRQRTQGHASGSGNKSQNIHGAHRNT